MKTALIIVLALLILAVGAQVLRSRRAADVTRGADNPYEGLRDQALAVSPSTLGLTVGADDTWGVLMDLPVSDATATIVAFTDGAASIYLSSGGGFIGGGQRPLVRMAAERFVEAARAATEAFAPATTYPLPQPGHVRFSVRVGGGVRTADATERELESGRHRLSAVYAAGQEVIAAYRETEK